MHLRTSSARAVLLRGLIAALLCALVLLRVGLSPRTVRPHRALSPPPLALALYCGDYGNTAVDGRWIGWGRRSARARSASFLPSSVPVSRFPAAGLYSSHDASAVRQHLRLLSAAGFDGVVLRWAHPARAPRSGSNASAGFSDATLQLLLRCAREFGLRAAVQIGDYEGRTARTVAEDSAYVAAHYADDAAYLRVRGRPALFVAAPGAVRGLRADSAFFAIASVAAPQHISDAAERGFGAVHPHSAAADAYGADSAQWAAMRDDAAARGIEFVPAVAPGYNTERTDAWSYRSTREREQCAAYDAAWERCVRTRPNVVVVDSFNDWFEGTAIEPEVTRAGYEAETDAMAYIERTRLWIDRYKSEVCSAD